MAATAHWARRLAEWLTAIVLAKFAIAVAFAVAGSMLGQARGGSGGLTALLGGCAVLLVAALSPWVLLRLIPFAEQAAGGLQRGHCRRRGEAAPGAAATSLLVRQAMLKNFGAGVAIDARATARGARVDTDRAAATPATASRQREAGSDERADASATSATYRFGPLERRGVAGGLRPGRSSLLGAACLFAVAIFRRLPTAGRSRPGAARRASAPALATGCRSPAGRSTNGRRSSPRGRWRASSATSGTPPGAPAPGRAA